MTRLRLSLGTFPLFAAMATGAGLLLAAAPELSALPPFICRQEKTTAIVSGTGATCDAALADAQAQAAALVPCEDTCLEVFEVTQECLGQVICNGSCHTRYVVSGRMRYRCRVEL